MDPISRIKVNRKNINEIKKVGSKASANRVAKRAGRKTGAKNRICAGATASSAVSTARQNPPANRTITTNLNLAASTNPTRIGRATNAAKATSGQLNFLDFKGIKRKDQIRKN